jgi:serine/threonine protein kinase
VLEIGATIGDYRLEELVGRGGMGVVYRATQLKLGRSVAIKLILPEVGEEEAFRARFKREARLAAGIDHPNVVPVYQADEEDGHLYIAMRYVEGTDLRSLVASAGRLAPGHATRLVVQIAAALDAAHAQGLVHRDVKPANVLLTGRYGEEHAYLTDFGLMKHTTSHGELTRSGAFVGTLDYAAPEQLRGWKVDARTDVYALGCLLYQLLTGEVPFPRDSSGAKVWAHMDAPPPRPTETAPGVPEGFDDVVLCAIAKDPDARYPSAGDLGRAALAAAGGDPVPEPPATDVERFATPARRRPARRHLVIAGATVFPLLAAAALALSASGGSDEGKSSQPVVSAAPSQAQAIAAVCDQVNRAQAARKERFPAYRRGIKSARSLSAQRDAIIDETEIRTAEAADLLTRLEALPAPSAEFGTVQRETVSAWSRNVRRLRSQRDALEEVTTGKGLDRVLGRFPRSAIERDADRVHTGLRQLGGPACSLDPVEPDPVLRVNTPGSRRASRAPEGKRVPAPPPQPPGD